MLTHKEPIVRLTNAFDQPFKNVLAAAKTCYSSKGLVEDVAMTRRDREIAKSIYQAGHHTTFQHPTFQFALDRVSRLFLWSFLHSHPFYNSEQVSQRYVEVKPENMYVPPLTGEPLKIYRATVEAQTADYQALIELLKEPVEREYYKRFEARRWTKDETEILGAAVEVTEHGRTRDIKIRRQEAARYVLPVATFAYLYHTVSGLTLLRYWRLCQQYDVPHEQQNVVQRMVKALIKLDPNYTSIIEDPIPLEETPEAEFFRNRKQRPDKAAFAADFDASLDGKISKLVDWKVNGEETLANAVRETLGASKAELPDGDAIRLALDPSKNRLLGENMNLTTHSKLARAMFHGHYTFRKKISHTADSQDQRHRMTPGSRPCLFAHLTEEPDYITPEIIRKDEAAHALYRTSMKRTWEGIWRLLEKGVSPEHCQYLLPNALSIRFSESGDLLNLRHKYVMRLCYNAQEEIWRASVDEVKQICEIHPRIGAWLLPPCTARLHSKSRPICPEGERYCGVPVWKLDLEKYERVI